MDDLAFDRLLDKATRRDNAADRRARVLGRPSIEEMARALAASGAALDDDCAVISAFVGKAIRPSDAGDDYHTIKAMAADLRSKI